jgi:glutathione peroxidase
MDPHMTARLLLAAALLCSSSAFAATCPALLDRTFKTVHGQDVDLCQYSDRAILVVNTASRCGFTPQFSKLQALYERYKDSGLMVIGFPSNDFRQELASNQEVGDFCLVNYGVKFPMIEKSSVKGPAATRGSRIWRRPPAKSPAGTSTSTSSRPALPQCTASAPARSRTRMR